LTNKTKRKLIGSVKFETIMTLVAKNFYLDAVKVRTSGRNGSVGAEYAVGREHWSNLGVGPTRY